MKATTKRHPHIEQAETLLTDCDFLIRIMGNKDSQGRQSHDLYWMADYHPGHPDGEYRTAARGQCYFSDVTEHVKRLREKGKIVKVVDTNGAVVGSFTVTEG